MAEYSISFTYLRFRKNSVIRILKVQIFNSKNILNRKKTFSREKINPSKWIELLPKKLTFFFLHEYVIQARKYFCFFTKNIVTKNHGLSIKFDSALHTAMSKTMDVVTGNREIHF